MRKALSLFVLLAMSPSLVHAHGSMTTPPSRVYACAQGNIENPTDPACRAAKEAGGTAAFYDWMSINQGAAAGNHRAVVPDGKLCSGGNTLFHGLDLPRADWQATTMSPRADGKFEFVFRGTAPHQSRDWIFYVTRDGWNPADPLRWDDLVEFCRYGQVPLVGGSEYKFECPFPPGSGRRVIYNVWQRSDSDEAFYTCVDVILQPGDAIFDNGFEPAAVVDKTDAVKNSTTISTESTYAPAGAHCPGATRP